MEQAGEKVEGPLSSHATSDVGANKSGQDGITNNHTIAGGDLATAELPESSGAHAAHVQAGAGSAVDRATVTRLSVFYAIHNPSLVPEAQQIALRYTSYQQLQAALFERYGADLRSVGEAPSADDATQLAHMPRQGLTSIFGELCHAVVHGARIDETPKLKQRIEELQQRCRKLETTNDGLQLDLQCFAVTGGPQHRPAERRNTQMKGDRAALLQELHKTRQQLDTTLEQQAQAQTELEEVKLVLIEKQHKLTSLTQEVAASHEELNRSRRQYRNAQQQLVSHASGKTNGRPPILDVGPTARATDEGRPGVRAVGSQDRQCSSDDKNEDHDDGQVISHVTSQVFLFVRRSVSKRAVVCPLARCMSRGGDTASSPFPSLQRRGIDLCVCLSVCLFCACARRRATLRCHYVRHFSEAKMLITSVKMQTPGACLLGDGAQACVKIG